MSASLSVPLLFPTRISAVLLSLTRNVGERLSVADIVAVLQDRAFAILVVLLGLPNCLPMPPPIPLICGLLLALVGAQIAAGLHSPWLPEWLLRKSVPQAAVTRAVTRAVPVMQRLERLSRQRFGFLETPIAFRLIGVLLLALALGLLVAAPIIGQIPIGLAVCLVGLGLVERDGILVLLGLAMGAAGLALNFGFAFAIYSVVEHLIVDAALGALPNLHAAVTVA